MPDQIAITRHRPLYEIKANLFKALAHPVRIRVLELLCETTEPVPVSRLLTETGQEATVLSQHLGVLRRHHVVTSRRVGNAVFYQLADPSIADLLVTARSFLNSLLTERSADAAALADLPPVHRR